MVAAAAGAQLCPLSLIPTRPLPHLPGRSHCNHCDRVMISDDTLSTFSYDDEADPDIFSLHHLQIAVKSHLSSPCHLKKLAEGGYHKVYDVLREDGTSLGVVRVAAPAFPKDKLESEVATLKFLAKHTKIPVPQVYAWDSDASNPVGAEYMILQKLPGTSANTEWDNLSMTVKERVVLQIAEYLKVMFALRFDRAGSLNLSPSKDDVYVGPIVTTPFYRALDGVVRVPGVEPLLAAELAQYRGPFSDTTNYLQSFLRAELHVLSHHHDIVMAELGEGDGETAERRLEVAKHTLCKALDLCAAYPGNHQPGGQIVNTSSKQFSLRLDDFRLSNIMIDAESGTVTGLIDFEGTITAPLWECAVVPGWLLDPDDQEGRYEGGSLEERQALCGLFFGIMEGTEWRRLYEHGKPFRHFRERLSLQAPTWISGHVENWLDERLAWAELHPGVALQEKN